MPMEEQRIEELAARMELLVFDVDGVLTPGGIIYGPGGEWKVFNVRDGHGFHLARRAGLKTALMSGRSSELVARRGRETGVSVVLQGIREKGAALEGLCGRLGIEMERTLYVGDDLVDLPAMRRAGLAVAVKDAVAEVRSAAAWITPHAGGMGAARDVIEMVLKARGVWDELTARYQRQEGRE